MFERTVTEHGLIAPWLFFAGLFVVAWHVARRVASRRARIGSRWSDVLIVTGVLVHINLVAALGALALAPRRPPWFEPRPISGSR